MASLPWWVAHLWVIAIQLIAVVPYTIGSLRFYRRRRGYLKYIGMGVILDIVITLVVLSGRLPRPEENQAAPWGSALFLAHIIMATAGMLGFFFIVIYILMKGYWRSFPCLREFQFKVLLPLWYLGVIIALVNFVVEVVWGIRLYDYL